MYHVYNLISEGDEVRALAVRRVQTVSSTGSSDSFRVRVNLALAVTKVPFFRFFASCNIVRERLIPIDDILARRFDKYGSREREGD